MNSQRIVELDSLRGIAALAVVIYHYFTRYDQLYGHEGLYIELSYFAKNGIYGVHLFFLVSGYVIYWTLHKTDQPLDFLVSRFSRLYPAYWIAIILTFTAVHFFGLPGRQVDIITALANILMFHEYLKIPHVDGVYWTLTIELTFYFIIFFIHFIFKLIKVEWIFSLLVIISTFHTLNILYIPAIVQKVLILKYVSLFLAGICFFKIINGISSKITIFALFLSLFSAIFVFSFKVFLLISFFYLIFYLSVTARFKLLRFKPLVFIGGISYSLYLIHQNIGYIIINKSYSLNINPLIGIACAFAISMILSTLMTKLVERPALRAVRVAYHDYKKI